MSGKTGPTWPCSAITTSIKFLIRWSSYGFSKLVPTNLFCDHEETLRRPFVIYSLTHANRKQAVHFYVLKVALQLYQSHLVEEICIPLDSIASVVCFTLAENGFLSGVGRTIFFNKTKCYRTSISSQTMCKFLYFKSSISQLLWHFLLQMLPVKWQWVNFTLSKVLVVQCIQTKC